VTAFSSASRFREQTKPRVRVLVIGDDPTHERHFRSELRKTHLEDCVLFIEDPRVALQALNARHGRLFSAELYAIILNLDAAELDWANILRQLKASLRTEDIPVILMSEMPDSWAQREIEEWKILWCLPRPIQIKPFGDAVSRAFHARNSQTAEAAYGRYV
jgi:PleD family two-component response regulator